MVEVNRLMPLVTCGHVAALGVHLMARTALIELRNSIIKQSIEDTDIKGTTGIPTTDNKVSGSHSANIDGKISSVLTVRSDCSERATEVITSEFICRVAFIDCFLITNRQDTSTVEETIKAVSNEFDDNYNNNGDKSFLSIKGKEHLELDDMLWIVDNQRLSSERRTEWQRFILKEREREESESFEQHMWQHPHYTRESTVKNDGVMTLNSSPRISVGHASVSQITLLRNGVGATSAFFAKLDEDENEYRRAVQEIREAEATRRRSQDLSVHKSLEGSRQNQNINVKDNLTTTTSDQSIGTTVMNRIITFRDVVSNGSPLREAFAASTRNAGGTIVNATDERIGDDSIAFRQLLAICPPVSWKETLSLNIVTQWTYTLTLAVVKYTTVARNLNTREVVHNSLKSTSRKPIIKNKELVVVRHVSKRVYGQPTKANFHSKHSRSIGGDLIDFPNIYFNIDDFEDDELFRDIRLCKGYTLAVLLTAGASRDSNAAVFRGALTYEQIMKRILDNPKQILSEYTGNMDVAGIDSSHSGNGKLGKLFIPLLGPEGKGKAEMSVSINEIDLIMSYQSSRYKGSSFGEEASNSSSSILEKLISKVTKRAPTPPLPVLHGNEAIQCCLTYISVHVQTVIDTIMNVEPLRPNQWLSFCTEKELECILSTG